MDTPEEAELPSLGAKSTAQERRYNTRPTNDPHPARTAHLARRSHAEVREALAAEIRQKKAELDAQRDEYQRRVNELAELEEDINSREIENSMENILEKESLMILADEAAVRRRESRVLVAKAPLADGRRVCSMLICAQPICSFSSTPTSSTRSRRRRRLPLTYV